MGDSTPANLRARVVTGLQRYFQLKRLQGLLSTRGLRILHYAAEKAAEELEHAPLGPLRLWELVEREIRCSAGIGSAARYCGCRPLQKGMAKARAAGLGWGPVVVTLSRQHLLHLLPTRPPCTVRSTPVVPGPPGRPGGRRGCCASWC